MFTRLHSAFPDLHVTVEDLIAEGDKVVGRNTVTGTHEGEYMGLKPTGRSITYNEIFIIRFADGRIAETWGVVDVLSQLRQLGAVPGGLLMRAGFGDTPAIHSGPRDRLATDKAWASQSHARQDPQACGRHRRARARAP